MGSLAVLAVAKPIPNPSNPSCTTVAPSLSVQTSVATNCAAWHSVATGEACYQVADQYGIVNTDLMSWNPAVGPPECHHMWAGYAVCVSTCGGSQIAASAAPSATVDLTATSVPAAPARTLVSQGTETAASAGPSATVDPASATVPAIPASTSASQSSLDSSTFTDGASSAKPESTSGSQAASSGGSGQPATSISPTVQYQAYNGDGSEAAGWPTIEEWIGFEVMYVTRNCLYHPAANLRRWASNLEDMRVGCDNLEQAVAAPNSEEDIATLKDAIKNVASSTGVDERYILANVMEESTGCVRVYTSA